MNEIKGLGDRWLCPDCGRVLTRPPTKVTDTPRRMGREDPVHRPGYYHSWKCSTPMLPVTVALRDGAASREARDDIARAICDSEPFAWLMAGSNHQEMQLASLREAWGHYVKAGGGWFRRAAPKDRA